MLHIFIKVRIPVPNQGACDWGLPNAYSCAYCQNYFDPRDPYGDNDDGKCVWVPSKGKCFPKKWATEELKLPFKEECSGSSIIL